MAAGIYPGGLGPAGAAPVASGPTPQRPRQPAAIRYEGSTADWVTDELGAYKAVTPVEQGVVLALCVRRGDIKSSPEMGNTLHEIVYLGSPDLADDIRKRVMTANPLARLVADGDAEIVRIDHEIGRQGFNVAVYFKDLSADKSRVLRRDASIVS